MIIWFDCSSPDGQVLRGEWCGDDGKPAVIRDETMTQAEVAELLARFNARFENHERQSVFYSELAPPVAAPPFRPDPDLWMITELRPRAYQRIIEPRAWPWWSCYITGWITSAALFWHIPRRRIILAVLLAVIVAATLL